MRLNRIDICLYANKCIARLNNNKEYIEDTRLIYMNSINQDLISLGGQDLSLFILKLYDDKYKDLPLTSRCSFENISVVSIACSILISFMKIWRIHIRIN